MSGREWLEKTFGMANGWPVWGDADAESLDAMLAAARLEGVRLGLEWAAKECDHLDVQTDGSAYQDGFSEGAAACARVVRSIDAESVAREGLTPNP